MFSAAFRSRPSTRPQAGHVCTRCASVLGTCSPQPEQRCVVPAGFTSDQRPSSFFRFDGQDREELAPASIVHGLGQHRTGQSLDVQVFDGDQPVLLHESRVPSCGGSRGAGWRRGCVPAPLPDAPSVGDENASCAAPACVGRCAAGVRPGGSDAGWRSPLPSLSTAKVVSPTSMPTARSQAGNGSGSGISTLKHTYQLASLALGGDRLDVASAAMGGATSPSRRRRPASTAVHEGRSAQPSPHDGQVSES